MTTLRALLYADRRAFVNQLREIRRSPGRAVVWLVFSAGIAALIAVRLIRAARGVPAHAAPAQLATDAIVCITVMLFGAALAIGDRYAGLFAHPAEARFIIGSPATPFVATLYVQLRQLALGSARQAFGLLYLTAVYLPASLPAAAFGRDLVFVLAAFTLIASVPLARQLLPRPLVPLAVTGGALVFLAGVLAAARDLALVLAPGSHAAGVLARLPALHPGHILVASASVQWTAIAALLVCAAAAFTGVARLARDAYPELYELSMKRIQRTERLRGGALFAAAQATAKTPVRSESMVGGAPPGVAIFIWRAWTEYRRTHDARATGLETALFLGGGYAVARFTAASDPDLLIAVVAPVVNIAFILIVMRAASLGSELRRPLFWLSGATLFERLCALALAQGWRIIGWCVLAGIGLAAGGAAVPAVLATAVAGPSAVLLAGAIGYTSYALLPHDIDQTGPLRLVRLLLGYVLIVPPVAIGIVAGMFERAAAVALVASSATTLLEAAVLIGFAAWRLDRTSISLR